MKTKPLITKAILLLFCLSFANCNSHTSNSTPTNAVRDSMTPQAIQDLQFQLTKAKGDLAAEQDKLEQVKKFKVGRTEDERAAQISDETQKIDNLNQKINDLQKQLN